MNLVAKNITPSRGRQDTDIYSDQIGNQDWNQMFPKWKQIVSSEGASNLPRDTNKSAQLLLNYQHTAVSLLSSILNQPNSLTLKCDQINRMISSFSNKELIELYPQLLIEIFGFSGNQIFGLNTYEPQNYYYDFNAAYSFLSTSGSLFKIINKLMVDENAEFHFPYNGLPAGIVEKINNGHISMWYQNKLMVLHGNEVVLGCNALEYYAMFFAYYIIHPYTLDQPSGWSGIDGVLYIQLLEDYLKYFFPIDVVKHPTLGSPTERKSSASLWKTFDDDNTPCSLQNIMPASHAEIFLQILSDIWFGLNPEIQLQEEEYKLPSVDHARVVRILVKYMHMFISGNSEVQIILFSSTHQQLNELKSVVIPVLMHKSLYIYLKHCFTHWPLASSFRMILETWLSFIQPWRYVDYYNNNNNKSLNDSVQVNMAQWKVFIVENLLFYSSIFQMFLQRALRFDMTSLHDMQLVYRVAKVFSQSSLSEILQDEMRLQLPCHGNVRSVTGQIPVGFMSTANKINFEIPAHNIPSIFGQEITKSVKDLCEKLVMTVTTIRQKSSQTADGKKTTILGIIKEFLIGDDENFNRDCENQQLIEYLDDACLLLSFMFNLPQLHSEGYLVDDPTSRISTETVCCSEDSLPDFTVTENGVELTDTGRYQILQGMRHFPITYSGDPELQPVRSYESVLAVKCLYWVACRLNTKYSNLLDKLCNQPGCNKILHRFSKQLHTTHYVNTPFNLPQPTTARDKLNPRISLRFAASYYFMGYVCWIIILARVFGFSWLIILFALIMFAVVCIFAHLDSPPKHFKES